MYVMLKVDLKFKLDHSFYEPYQAHRVTDICASIQPLNYPNKETTFVSTQ